MEILYLSQVWHSTSDRTKRGRRDLLAALIVPEKAEMPTSVLLDEKRTHWSDRNAALPGFIRELTERIEACENRGQLANLELQLRFVYG